MQSQLEISGQKGSNLTTIVVVAVLIGIGAALKAVAPPIFGITPNLVIAMYCLAILLTRPKLSGALVIGLVSGVASMLTSKSTVPYINLISDPAGALVCYLVAAALSNAKLSKYLFKPVLATFLGTVASGGLFVFITMVILSWKGAAALTAFTAVVVPTAVINAVIAYVLYLPTQRVLKIKAD